MLGSPDGARLCFGAPKTALAPDGHTLIGTVMTTNNKGGRPLSPHKKNHRINVRFDEQEYRMVLHNARMANMKKSEWVRKSAILKKITPRYTPEQLKVFRDFTGAANNLNQLTKKAHQIGLSQMAHECQGTIDHINRCVDKLLEHGGENH